MSAIESRRYRVPSEVSLGQVFLGQDRRAVPALIYRYTSRDRKQRVRRGLLAEFRRLVAASDSDILNFAKNNGVLENAPSSDPQAEATSVFEKIIHDAKFTDNGECYETLAVWKERSRTLDALLRVASKLKSDGEPEAQNWKTLCGEVPQEATTRRSDGRRKLFLEYVNQWLWRTELGPSLIQDGDGFETRLRVENLSGALGLLLMEAVIGRAFALCAGGPHEFVPDSTHRKYCADCARRRIPHRLAQQRHSRKRKSRTRKHP